MRSAVHADDRIRREALAMRFGFAADGLPYAIDLGMPQPGGESLSAGSGGE